MWRAPCSRRTIRSKPDGAKKCPKKTKAVKNGKKIYTLKTCFTSLSSGDVGLGADGGPFCVGHAYRDLVEGERVKVFKEGHGGALVM